MNLLDTYQFFITLPGNIEEQVFPCNRTIEVTEAQFKDHCFFRKTLDSGLVFNDKELFARLWELEKDRCMCKVADIRITEADCEGNFLPFLTGKIAFVDAEWNPEQCKVEFKVRTSDGIDCLLNTWQEDKNYLAIEDRREINTIEGEVVCQDTTGFLAPLLSFEEALSIAFNNSSPPAGSGWVLIKIEIQSGMFISTYCRQQLAVAPADLDGWTLEGGFYVSTVPVRSFFERVEDGIEYQLLDFEADNGIAIGDFFEFYLSECYDCIVSNFFNVNPDGTAPDNYEYGRAAVDFADVLLFQTSDIIAPDGSNSDNVNNSNQVAGVLNFKAFWDELIKLIPLCIWYDENTDCLRIEHCSYLEEGQAVKVLDLTNEAYASCLVGKGRYSTDPVDVPLSKTLEYSIKTINGSFNTNKIAFDPDCSNPDEDTNTESETVTGFSNDFTNIYDNSELSTDETQLDNITLVSTTGNMINSASGVLNGQFSISYLLRNYHLRKQPQCSGRVSGTVINFFSTQNIRGHEPVRVNLSVDHYNLMNAASDRVKTFFGECEIKSVTRVLPIGDTDFELCF